MAKRLPGSKPAPHIMDLADFYVHIANDGRATTWVMHPQLERELAIVLATHAGTLPGIMNILKARQFAGIGMQDEGLQ